MRKLKDRKCPHHSVGFLQRIHPGKHFRMPHLLIILPQVNVCIVPDIEALAHAMYIRITTYDGRF